MESTKLVQSPGGAGRIPSATLGGKIPAPLIHQPMIAPPRIGNQKPMASGFAPTRVARKPGFVANGSDARRP
ncbi:MAG: hypothetical protein WCC57_00845 [Paracoccaceae bacterium]